VIFVDLRELVGSSLMWDRRDASRTRVRRGPEGVAETRDQAYGAGRAAEQFSSRPLRALRCCGGKARMSTRGCVVLPPEDREAYDGPAGSYCRSQERAPEQVHLRHPLRFFIPHRNAAKRSLAIFNHSRRNPSSF